MATTKFDTTAVSATDVYGDDCREYELATPLVVEGEAMLYLDKPAPRKLDEKYTAMANLRHELTWTDPYFDEEDFENDVIAVFDFDYPAMETFYTSMGWATFASTILYTPFFVASLLGGAPCYLRKNVEWSTRTQHVAITHDGIRFVHDRRPCCWGLAMCDRGKSSKTVPFDKITDCDIAEPAGNSCLCVPNILTTVNVDTASSGAGAEGRKELKLAGLKDPHSFKKLVWAMKRSQRGSSAAPPSFNAVMADRGQGNGGEEVAVLLREIRDELRANNDRLQQHPPSQEFL